MQVSDLWRYPIKSHGRETLDNVVLAAGQTLPWDRHWAVTHDKTKFDAAAPDWVSCRNFMIGASLPGLAGIWAKLDERARQITLRHARLGTITFAPDEPADVQRFLDWVAPLSADTSLTPTGLATAGARGMTDTDYPTVTVMSHASHAAVSARLGGGLEAERWRGNIWLEGLAPWQEMEWVGKSLRIGEAVLTVIEPAERCRHTEANPVTGQRDADTLGVLNDTFGHQFFGMYCTVETGGRVACGDRVEVI